MAKKEIEVDIDKNILDALKEDLPQGVSLNERIEGILKDYIELIEKAPKIPFPFEDD